MALSTNLVGSPHYHCATRGEYDRSSRAPFALHPSDREYLLHTRLFGDTFDKPAADGVIDSNINSTAYWIQQKRWPNGCFDQDDQTRKDFEKDSWLEKYWEPVFMDF
jgi:hypothetical protein